ncbi:hypothetical protein C8Q70DRAFT_1056970 [Cubamyces menziesii]|nr:hypothetical protein C8Q70DRAFT_1056970 [Cubamyces menziesii]
MATSVKDVELDKSARGVFVSIFKGGKNARRDVRWEDFERAMKHAGFEVKTMDGSARRFTPPPSWDATCITFHKPSCIIYKKKQDKLRARLRRAYGWTAGDFLE